MAEWHETQLRLHCRVCGGRVKKARSGRATREYACSELSDELWSAFGICITEDSKDIHPTHMCRSCHDAITRKERMPHTFSFEWQTHELDCRVSKTHTSKPTHINIVHFQVCNHFNKTRGGGRPKKPVCATSLLEHIDTIAPVPSTQAPALLEPVDDSHQIK